ncbi:MAG: sigma-54-dependent Fis family transcriptional regulator, partial [Cytophagales bacterium CG18_big_fil_WC_8_21_14_2_50_42_9]
DLFPPEFQQITPLAASAYSDTALSTVERNHIAQILKQTNGNKAETARLP